MTTQPIALIFGFGKNVGVSVASAFSLAGYKIATVSRSPTITPQENYTHIQGDLSDPTSISSIFTTVRSKLGEPSVVIYNAASSSHHDKPDPLSISLENALKDLNINTLSVLASAKEAKNSFSKLPATASKTFIFTGNALNKMIIPPLMSAGMAKSATAHLLESAALAYKGDGYKFYYADERTSTGAPVYSSISGAAAGEFYLKLSEGKEQGPWFATFVKGDGYVDFYGAEK